MQDKKLKGWEYRKACKLRKKDWINKDGAVNEAVKTRYDELEEASSKISSCLGSKDNRKALIDIKQLSRKFENGSPNGQKRMKIHQGRQSLDYLFTW